MKLNKKRVRNTIGIVIVIIVAALAGRLSVDRHASDAQAGDSARDAASSKQASIWTCSMHPQIKLPKPGQCPICSMDLIPLDSDKEDAGGLRELSVSESSARLMEIETTPVERRFVTADVRMVGKIDYDETRVSYITAWVPGRLDRLFVDYTGVPVKKGDHMVYLYSPELLSAQEELLQAISATKELARSDVSIVRDTTESMVTAVREKLRLWGLTLEQIEAIEERGKPQDHITIYAPSGGIVIHKNAQEGMYVNTGTRIYTIADLSRVWVNLNAYESDLAWLRYGQHVRFTVESYPGESFDGTISFIHPVLNQATRTVKVRVNVPNDDGRLKPGMFVRATVKAELATDGRIMNADLAGKWISPMHPEIVKDEPGSCDVCGMPLVRAESLGYVGEELTNKDKPLVIPASAALLTGKRAIVYVRVPAKERPTFEGREITVGRRAGSYYLVQHGLEEGERVVTKGNFKLDAELQIQAKPSMMTAESDSDAEMAQMDHSQHAAASAWSVNPEFKQQLGGVISAYLDVQVALALDDAATAKQGAQAALAALSQVEMRLVTGEAHNEWMKLAPELKKILNSLIEADGIEPVRVKFALLSEQIVRVLTRFGAPDAELYKAWCPMAFDNRGASWIQSGREINNPYFGETMLRCGEIREVLK